MVSIVVQNEVLCVFIYVVSHKQYNQIFYVVSHKQFNQIFYVELLTAISRSPER